MDHTTPDDPRQPPPAAATPAASGAWQGVRQGMLWGAVLGLVLSALSLGIVLPALRAASHLAPAQHQHTSGAAAPVQAPGLPGRVSVEQATPAPAPPRLADFGTARGVSAQARHVADWIADARDNAGMDFVLLDKKAARLYVFNAAALLQADTPALLGAARGDASVPGIGSRPIPQVRPEERTTPAGRFIGQAGTNAGGEDVVWVDYDAAVSMHRVRTTNPREHRLARLASPTVADNRISYGCINLPVAFYESQVRPRFAQQRAVVYVLPDVLPLQQVFPAYHPSRAESP